MTGLILPAMMHARIMAATLLSILVVGLYAVGSWPIWRSLRSGTELTPANRQLLLGLTFAAVLLHGLLLYHTVWHPSGLNFSITSAFSAITFVVVLLYLAATFLQPVATVGALLLPLAAALVIMAWLWPGKVLNTPGSSLQALHIMIAMLAYSLLCLAAVQSLLLLLLERNLRQRQGLTLVQALPPMQTMERLMFQMIGVGFLLLTATLITGGIFSETLFGKPFRFTHHMVLAVIGWAVYAVLLTGRWRFGWRGRTAVHWTLAGFGLLVLAYFGSKFVLEVLLGRV